MMGNNLDVVSQIVTLPKSLVCDLKLRNIVFRCERMSEFSVLKIIFKLLCVWEALQKWKKVQIKDFWQIRKSKREQWKQELAETNVECTVENNEEVNT